MKTSALAKLIYAKQLEYEAIKEMLPIGASKGLDGVKEQVVKIGREVFMEYMKIDENGKEETKQQEKKAKKVNIL